MLNRHNSNSWSIVSDVLSGEPQTWTLLKNQGAIDLVWLIIIDLIDIKGKAGFRVRF
jgi:hypothetical protein